MSRAKQGVYINAVSQLMSLIIGLATFPLLFSEFGGEGYGLIGFFLSAQLIFSVLDAGLPTAIAREVARTFGANGYSKGFGKLLLVTNRLTLVLGLLAILLVSAFAQFFSNQWFSTSELPIETVKKSVLVIGLIIGIRVISSVHRGVLLGGERFLCLAVIQVCVTLFRYVFVFFPIYYIDLDILGFFYYQAIISFAEYLSLRHNSSRVRIVIAKMGELEDPGVYVPDFVKFSMGLMGGSFVWTVFVQADKIIFSTVLSLEDFGALSLALVVANSILLMQTPISLSTIPRLSSAMSETGVDGVIKEYRNLTRFVACFPLAVAAFISFFASEFIAAWSGSDAVADKYGFAVALFSAGNASILLSAFPYYLQVALGNLEFHNKGSLLQLFFFIPIYLWACFTFGPEGGAVIWLLIGVFNLFFWTTWIHFRLAPSLVTRWLFFDVLSMVSPIIGFILAVKLFSVLFTDGRLSIVQLGVIAGAVGLLSLIRARSAGVSLS